MVEFLKNYSTSEDLLVCINHQNSPSKIDAITDHESTMGTAIKDSDGSYVPPVSRAYLVLAPRLFHATASRGAARCARGR